VLQQQLPATQKFMAIHQDILNVINDKRSSQIISNSSRNQSVTLSDVFAANLFVESSETIAAATGDDLLNEVKRYLDAPPRSQVNSITWTPPLWTLCSASEPTFLWALVPARSPILFIAFVRQDPLTTFDYAGSALRAALSANLFYVFPCL